jgi:hypothetical protein
MRRVKNCVHSTQQSFYGKVSVPKVKHCEQTRAEKSVSGDKGDRTSDCEGFSGVRVAQIKLGEGSNGVGEGMDSFYALRDGA